jgi:carbamoylphosphate synthase large subunit
MCYFLSFLCSISFDDPNKRNLVAEVSTPAPKIYNAGGSPRILAIDCGMKNNIIRYLTRRNVELTVVPYNYDISSHPHPIDGIFISNGPGDPTMCAETIVNLRKIISPALKESSIAAEAAANEANHSGTGMNAAAVVANTTPRPTPVFGICLGNQLLALAAGASTYKMKYGNRGMNQPCVDMRTMRCYITPQNHGFAVDATSLPPGWKPFFINANDLSNEGIIHTHLPFFSVQFHPEANGGPLDTEFLFDMFMEQVAGSPPVITTVDASHYLTRARHVRKVLVLGSGGLSIGQAGEFDYSGSQAIKALKEEGVEVILINPNIATVQTSKGMADHVYFLPVTANFVTEIIQKEKPEGIIISMGGQTALNVGVKLHRDGILQKYNVKILGTQVAPIEATEDRELFAKILAEIGETIALSYPATNIEDAVVAAAKIGYPVLVRAAYALGGLGSGFADDEASLRELCAKSFAVSDQILIDQDLRGWKEVEYEVVRDANNNCITVCNMENFDPLGVHTGDSIVVAPSQTLSNTEYYKLRSTALKVVRHLGIVGECNIQYALDPHSTKYCIIEVNARLSRSSALASKATGYPLAYVAAKIALGHDLVSLRNSITKTTTACFEPSLDYLVVKMPRWDLKKFGARVDHRIGSAMKSVGEVMSIGRTFEEAIQKAVRMVNPALSGFHPPSQTPAQWIELTGYSNNSTRPSSPSISSSNRSSKNTSSDLTVELDKKLKIPSDTRLLDIAMALDLGYSVERIHQLTRIDRWFLSKLFRINHISKQLKETASRDGMNALTPSVIRLLKRAGFSDRQIASGITKGTNGDIKVSELDIRKLRIAAGVTPFVKQIDTLAAEFPAATNYLYMTYHGSEHDIVSSSMESSKKISGEHRGGVMVLGGGAYCIGSSVEFDWCSVSCVRALRQSGFKAIVVNYNPETVSTDYDESDRLYFEELSLERVLDIYDLEQAAGVIVSVGGQIPNNLALPLHKAGVTILGTSPESIDICEDRHKFSSLLDSLSVDQPAWSELTSIEDVKKFAADVGYPVLIRPSYVLSGAAMAVVTSDEQIVARLEGAADVSNDHPVVVSKFILNAKEIEFDAVAQNGKILNYAISEHVENAGVHSGDATLVLPAQKLYVETIRQIKKISSSIAKALNISGPFNIQFMSRENDVKVIECNLRASRTFPFISKTFDFNFITLATKVMAGMPCKPGNFSLVDLDYVGIKAPQFSFTRLQGADPTLGVEMMSTGEVACFGHDQYEAFLLSIQAAGFKLPSKEKGILVSIGDVGKIALLDSLRKLQSCGYTLYATEGTAEFLTRSKLENITVLHKPSSSESPSAIEYIQNRKVDLVINDSEASSSESFTDTDGYLIRRAAIDFGVSLITNTKLAILLSIALERVPKYTIRSMEEYYQTSASSALEMGTA